MSSTAGQETFVERSIHNVRQNKMVLAPALRRWGKHDPEAVPHVDFLFHEVQELMKDSSPDNANEGDIHKDCWALRKLMTMVKAQLSKTNPPRASSPKYFIAFLLFILELDLHFIFHAWLMY